ncbi:putative T7SS-secreted protein [Streptomyces sp. 6N223]|uniref:putative T7SS-secreted protein n=1 Tax=Streptomyces sp. 6N223 TaxID=3457412 RepID=UPI003FD04997
MVDPPRASDWSPLTDGEDPVPGDWEAVKEAAERYRNMADLIQRVSDTLDSVHEDTQRWKGETANAFRDRSTDLSDSVIRAKGRYQEAADALDEYWPALKTAQEDSEELRTQAVAEQDTLDTYGPLAEETEDEDAENHDQHQGYQDQIDTANTNLGNLRSQLNTLVDDKNTAAQNAADRINEFISNDGLKNSGGLWGAFQDFMGTVGQWAGTIAGWAGIASIFLGWVPILGQALVIISVVGSAISLVGNLVNGNFAAAGLDALGILTGGVVGALSRGARAAGAANRLSAYSNILARGRGTIPRSTRVTNARMMGGGRNALTAARDSTRAAAPNGFSSFAQQTGRNMWHNATFRGGGPSGFVSGISDMRTLAQGGELAASTVRANAYLYGGIATGGMIDWNSTGTAPWGQIP